jgi:hypothetical protein
MYLNLFLPVNNSVFFIIAIVIAIMNMKIDKKILFGMYDNIGIKIINEYYLKASFTVTLLLIWFAISSPILLCKFIIIFIYVTIIYKSPVNTNAFIKTSLIFLTFILLEFYFNSTELKPMIHWADSPASDRLILVWGEPTWVSFLVSSVVFGLLARKVKSKFDWLFIFLLLIILFINKSKAGLLIFCLGTIFPLEYKFQIRKSVYKVIFVTSIFFIVFLVLISASGRELFDPSGMSRIEPINKIFDQHIFHFLFGNINNQNINNEYNIGLYERSLGTIIELLYRIGIVGLFILIIIIIKIILNSKSPLDIFIIIFPAFIFSLFHPGFEVPIIFLVLWSTNEAYRYTYNFK